MENFDITLEQFNQYTSNQAKSFLPTDQTFEALQIQLPAIIGNQLSIKKQQPIPDEPPLMRSERKKAKFYYDGPVESLTESRIENRHTFYTIVKMLFAQIPGVNPFDINIMDTIFYSPDNTSAYIYTDFKKGLTRVKNKSNLFDMFLKRKFQIDEKLFIRNSSSSALTFQPPPLTNKKTYSKYLNYVAILKYKNDTFLRLKENQFKSLFIRPMQANEKFKHLGNTQFIQIIPNEVNYEEGTLVNVQFQLDNCSQTSFFKKIQEMHYKEISTVNGCKNSQVLRGKLLMENELNYLYCIIFELYAYVNIHYHKKIMNGCFEFMKLGKKHYYLANVRNIKLNENQNNKLEYLRLNILEKPNNQDEADNDNFITSILQKTLENFLDKENSKIKNSMESFIKTKFDNIKNVPDLNKSKEIFKSINPSCPDDFHNLIDNRIKYNGFMKRKQNQMDGFSHINSMSNIARKKKVKHPSPTKSAKKSQHSAQKITKRKFELFLNHERKSSEKWKKYSKNKCYTKNLYRSRGKK